MIGVRPHRWPLQGSTVWLILAFSGLFEAKNVLMVFAIFSFEYLQHKFQWICIPWSILLFLVDLPDLLKQKCALDVVNIPEVLLVIFNCLRVILEAFGHFLQVVPDVSEFDKDLTAKKTVLITLSIATSLGVEHIIPEIRLQHAS